MNTDRVRARLELLSDAEARDLAARVKAPGVDPMAGSVKKAGVVICLVAVLLLLVATRLAGSA